MPKNDKKADAPPDANALERLIGEKENLLDVLQGALKRAHKKLQAAEEGVTQAKSDVRRVEQALNMLKEQQVVARGVPQDIAEQRAHIMRKHERVEREDITIATQKRVRGELHEQIAVLQAACGHPLVLDYDAHYASSADEDTGRDHSYDGTRVCVVCGCTETSEWKICAGYPLAVYAELAEKDGRLIKRDWERCGRRLNEPRNIRRPLEFFLRLFWDAAGCMNVEWPKEHKAKHAE